MRHKESRTNGDYYHLQELQKLQDKIRNKTTGKEVLNTNKTIIWQKSITWCCGYGSGWIQIFILTCRSGSDMGSNQIKKAVNVLQIYTFKWSNSLLITYMLRKRECSKSLAAARVMYTHIQTLPTRNTYTGMTILQT